MNVEDLKNIIIRNFLSQTTSKHYCNESSIRFKLAIEIFKEYNIEPMLDWRIPISKNREYLDIYLKSEERIGIELKYKTKAVEHFLFTEQGAQDNGKYDFIKDLSRIERFIKDGHIDRGFVVLITNDTRYRKPSKAGSGIADFDFLDKTKTTIKYTPRWKGRIDPISLKNTIP